MSKPFTVRTLAEYWDCSEQHVRNLIHRGDLQVFRIGGKLLRISQEEVQRWQKTSTSASTGANTAPSSTKTDNEDAIRSARLIEPSQTLDLPNTRGLNVYSLKAAPQQ